MSLPLFKQIKWDALKDDDCYQDFVVFSSSRQPPSVTVAGQPAKRLSRIGWAFEAGGTMNAKTTWAEGRLWPQHVSQRLQWHWGSEIHWHTMVKG